jgi:hypothetical protein
MPRYFDVRATVLIVVGYGILSEEEDRPIAYELRDAINQRADGEGSRSAVVVTDMWLLNQEMGDLFPAIALGGPGANALAAQIYEDLPVAWNRDQRAFVQMHPDSGKRAAVWGMDHGATREAVEVFVREGWLDRFLDLVWHRNG